MGAELIIKPNPITRTIENVAIVNTNIAFCAISSIIILLVKLLAIYLILFYLIIIYQNITLNCLAQSEVVFQAVLQNHLVHYTSVLLIKQNLEML